MAKIFADAEAIYTYEGSFEINTDRGPGRDRVRDRLEERGLFLPGLDPVVQTVVLHRHRARAEQGEALR